jgi:hypothetical protein
MPLITITITPMIAADHICLPQLGWQVCHPGCAGVTIALSESLA